MAANGLGVRDGLLSGELFLRVNDTEKIVAATRLLLRLRVSPDHAAAVGDSNSDADIARVAALSIAYNSKARKLLEVASYVIPYGDLARIPIILERHEEDAGK